MGGYQVIAGYQQRPEAAHFYVQDTWVAIRTAGRTSGSRRSGTCAPQNCSQKIYLLERLTADIELSKLAGQQATLIYDDLPPFLDVS